jgi:hypothetical protein
MRSLVEICHLFGHVAAAMQKLWIKSRGSARRSVAKRKILLRLVDAGTVLRP